WHAAAAHEVGDPRRVVVAAGPTGGNLLPDAESSLRVVSRAAADQQVLAVAAIQRAGAGPRDQDVAPPQPTVERVATQADQQVEHTVTSRRAAATEDRSDAADRA